jgi:hypothetical protein
MPTSRRLTLPIQAINDAARQDPAAAIQLTQAADRVRTAQLRGRAAELPRVTESYRSALARMEARAVASIEASGRRVTAALRTRIRHTLTATASDPEDRVALRQGRLSREATPAGFDVFGPTTRALRLLPKTGANASARPPAAGASPADDPQRRRAQVRLRTALATARAKVRGLETRAHALEKVADREARTALVARQRAETARQAADAVDAEVRQARAELAAAEEASKRADAAR